MRQNKDLAIERLSAALRMVLPYAKPFRSKPVGAPYSPARLEQDRHIVAYDTAVRALNIYDTGKQQKEIDDEQL